MDFNDIISASSRRSLTVNQIDLAKQRYRASLIVGFKGSLFEASDSLVSIMKTKMSLDSGWGWLIMDMNSRPVFVTSEEGQDLFNKVIEANEGAGRAYLLEYEKIISQTKSEMILSEEETKEAS